MKTAIKTLLATLALSSSPAFASSENLNPDLSAMLNQMSSQGDQISIRAVDASYVHKAAARLGSNIKVDLKNNQRMNYKKKATSGGVLIGSGSDSVVPTSNLSSGGPVVVHPPITPETSITVVGRPTHPNVPLRVCAAKYMTDAQNAYVYNGRFDKLPSGNVIQCVNVGTPIRLKAGTYKLILVTRSEARENSWDLGSSQMIVALGERDNLVIPLREIYVPKIDGNIAVEIYRDPKTEQELYKLKVDSYVGFIGTEGSLENGCSYLESQLNNLFCGYTTTMGFGVGTGKDGDHFPVFPGGYQIKWTIDEQSLVTKGILVE